MKEFIYQQKEWPNFIWNSSYIIDVLAESERHQGLLMGKIASLGFDLQQETLLESLTIEIVKNSEIEGEFLESQQVRSSVARKLGLEFAGMHVSDRHVDGVVDIMLDATQNCFKPLTKNRLFDWHAALFPTGRSGIFKIPVATWRDDAQGPMQVISGSMKRQNVHFQAPPAKRIDAEMSTFIHWFNAENMQNLLLKAAVAHLWFVTIHPFADGNGRITRVLTDMILAKSDHSSQRFYSISAQIKEERTQYYDILEKTQRGTVDITGWILWFLQCITHAIHRNNLAVSEVLIKAEFWKIHAQTIMNPRQQKVVNKLFDNFKGNLTSEKWAKLTKCSKDTAIRDINDLIKKGILQKAEAGGRSTNYTLCLPKAP